MSPTGDAIQRLVLGLVGVVLFLALWQAIGTYKLAGLTWPPLTDVIAYLVDPSRRALLLRASGATFSSVALGYAVGILAGIGFAMAGYVFARSKPGLDRLIAMVHAVPLIALGPIFIVFMSRDAIPMAIAALAVFYMIYVATTSGLAASSQAHRDVFRALGARPATRFLRLDFPAALPAVISGMKLAIPVAFIGGIVGEWFGATRGLGLLMVSAMQNFQITLLWSAVLITTMTSLILFNLMGLVERAAYGRYR